MKYQQYISPLYPPTCRYFPTCSNYAITAIKKMGILKGGLMAIARIIRCNPLIKGGKDTVPDHFTIFRNNNEK